MMNVHITWQPGILTLVPCPYIILQKSFRYTYVIHPKQDAYFSTIYRDWEEDKLSECGYSDEDDSNDENNWRNDYPDEEE